MSKVVEFENVLEIPRDRLIHEFGDYRDFLQQLFIKGKTEYKKFSYQYFSEKTGTTRSYLKLVVEKKRHISVDKISSISRFFNFSDFEKQFFTFLFFKNVSSESSICSYFESVLNSLKRNVGNESFAQYKFSEENDLSSEVILGDWVAMALQALFTVETPDEVTENWLHSAMGGEKVVQLKVVQDTLRRLIEAKVLVEKDGSLRATDLVWFHPIDPYNVDGFKKFRGGFERAIIATNEVETFRDIHFQSFCGTLDQSGIEEISSMLDKVEERFFQLSQKPKEFNENVKVMMFNGGFFPVLQKT